MSEEKPLLEDPGYDMTISNNKSKEKDTNKTFVISPDNPEHGRVTNFENQFRDFITFQNEQNKTISDKLGEVTQDLTKIIYGGLISVVLLAGLKLQTVISIFSGGSFDGKELVETFLSVLAVICLSKVNLDYGKEDSKKRVDDTLKIFKDVAKEFDLTLQKSEKKTK